MHTRLHTHRMMNYFMTTLGPSKRGRLLMRVLLWSFVADMIIVPSLFVKLSMFPRTTSFVAIAATIDHSPELVISSEIAQYIRKLDVDDLHPKAVKTITHLALNGVGTLITIADDNIQVFEYSDNATALREAAALSQRYESRSRSKEWKNNMHVYVDGKLVIFYMGNKEKIISAVDTDR